MGSGWNGDVFMRGKKGVAWFNVWLLVFGFVGVVFMMGGVWGLRGPSGRANVGSGAGGGTGIAKETVTYTPTGVGGDSMTSNFLKLGDGTGMSSLATGVQWAAIGYYGGIALGDAFGFDEDNSEALGTALGAGLGTYSALSTYVSGAGATGILGEGSLSFVGANPAIAGLVVAAVIFVATYKESETEDVTFSCMPWQAPTGGNDCETCNDEELPCSEYRCRSLGQSCELVNEGTADEKCVYVNPNDVVPPVITPDYDLISPGHTYKNVRTSPPGPGFEIVNNAGDNGCLDAFTPLEFGVITDEPAQCKIDFNSTSTYDEMIAYFGGSNLYSYNHSESFSLPGAKELSGSGFVLTNGKDLTFYMRCQDKNGNTNEAEYALDFCVDPSPDTTAPVIEATSIVNGGCVAENTDEAEVVFYANEPSDCRWSFQDQDFDVMENEMRCSRSAVQLNALTLFGCTASLTGIPRDGVDYYVRCKDQPGKIDEDRNENGESFRFDLRGSVGLSLKNLNPNGTVFGGVSPAPVELYVETLYGCNEGLAVCGWSENGVSFVEFYDTEKEDGIHTQRLDLTAGLHEYYVKCVDAGGNVAEDVASFEVDIDTNAPSVARVYEEDGMLKIVTVRTSECSYSLSDCDFTFSEGVEMPIGNTTVHVVDWNEEDTYYIKCRDEFLNEGPECSLVVRPTTNFL